MIQKLSQQKFRCRLILCWGTEGEVEGKIKGLTHLKRLFEFNHSVVNAF